jgi:hypothetical protein
MIELDREELNGMGFPVVVEQWDRVMGSGSKRRKYLNEFTEKQRKTIKRYYNTFYRWYLVEGTPEKHRMYPETLILLRNVCYFFGTV